MDSNQINIEYKVRKVGRWEIEPNWMGVWFQMNETETSDGVIFMASKDFPTSVKKLLFHRNAYYTWDTYIIHIIINKCN